MEIIRKKNLKFLVIDSPIGVRLDKLKKISHSIIPEGEEGEGSCTINLHMSGDIPDILIPYDNYQNAEIALKTLEKELLKCTFQVLHFNTESANSYENR